MKMFDPVIIGCDRSTLDVAVAIRGALELFRLRVYLHDFAQKQEALYFLQGRIPASEYVVLCCHGLDCKPKQPAAEMKLALLDLVHQVDRRWDATDVILTPENIPELVHLPGRKIVCLGCAGGREPLAAAFLKSGCQAYIGAIEPIDQDAIALFAITFFYHLLSAERDPALTCTDQEAVTRAAQVDTTFSEGTHLFRYYEAQRE